jgi:putative ABC transport system permease protein
MFLPSLQETRDVAGATLLVRMATRADIQADAIRREVLSLEPRLASTERHETLAAYLANQLEPRRRGALFVVAFGTFALLLACVGVYGATSHFVALRTREFGIRLALGAQASQVRGFVLREGLRLGVLGVIIGTLGGLVVTRGIGATILGASHWNLSTLLLACVVLLSSISIASWLPAYRATRVDPVAALRHE